MILESMKKPSEEFINAFCDSGSVVVTCDLCGITLFASADAGCFDLGELDGLRENAKNNPEKYKEFFDYNSVYYGIIGGKTVVPHHSVACDEKIAKYEQWVLNHRYSIAKYLNKRIQRLEADIVLEKDMTAIKKELE